MMNNFINGKYAMKRLQFGTSKCIKRHIGRTCNEHLSKDLYVDEWKLEVDIDPDSGNPAQSEVFG